MTNMELKIFRSLWATNQWTWEELFPLLKAKGFAGIEASLSDVGYPDTQKFFRLLKANGLSWICGIYSSWVRRGGYPVRHPPSSEPTQPLPGSIRIRSQAPFTWKPGHLVIQTTGSRVGGRFASHLQRTRPRQTDRKISWTEGEPESTVSEVYKSLPSQSQGPDGPMVTTFHGMNAKRHAGIARPKIFQLLVRSIARANPLKNYEIAKTNRIEPQTTPYAISAVLV
ncbi:hypothetical protein BDK51DRAFT_32585 [Blyttiomyces helicus]|uniref:Xylose isomerase-like TIM barrel domain-containing protein n=1 Tax=Blyttiomyces helicus TaxID=388810 RepID=A0A4V1IQ74_9FUNG|nr:hypothetical protein BDK51DRAFT_32585 [Blyttiomyces helicus]|eukprot:RKO85567.1 hypothetical protein BDK51DRAFT_32585 [Blyttiomyces helicus]